MGNFGPAILLHLDLLSFGTLISNLCWLTVAVPGIPCMILKDFFDMKIVYAFMMMLESMVWFTLSLKFSSGVENEHLSEASLD